MSSFSAKAATACAATALFLGLAAAPASAQAPGHWAYKGAYPTYGNCAQVRDQYEAMNTTALCYGMSGGSWGLKIWVSH